MFDLLFIIAEVIHINDSKEYTHKIVVRLVQKVVHFEIYYYCKKGCREYTLN